MITNINKIPKNITGIYIINYDNGKIYIGQALNIRSRANEHNNKNKQLCDLALKKHNALISVLEEVNDIEQLEEKEKFYILKYNATNRNIGYNILDGGNASNICGVNNKNAMFSQQQLDDIVDLLINHTELSIKDIANMYHVNNTTILHISKGQTYINKQLTYPLRIYNHASMKKDDIKDYFKNEEELLQLKEDLLYRWDLTIEKDLIKKYNIPLKILREINTGKKFNNVGNYNYPIRKKNVRNNANFTQKDILNILDLLKDSNMSMTDIGILYKVHRNTIANINNGKNYIIKDYKYPAR